MSSVRLRRATKTATARGQKFPPPDPLYFLPARLGQTARSAAEMVDETLKILYNNIKVAWLSILTYEN
jgi:hypothetical protein